MLMVILYVLPSRFILFIVSIRNVQWINSYLAESQICVLFMLKFYKYPKYVFEKKGNHHSELN